MFATQITRRVRSYFEDRSVSIRGRVGSTKRLSRPARFERLEDRTLLSITAGLGAANTLQQPQYVPGEILVGFEGDVAATFAKHGATAAMQAAGRQFGGLNLNALDVLFELPETANHAARLATRWQLPGNADVQATAEQLASLPGIAYAEPNYIVSAAALPTDPKFDELWGLDNLGQTGGVADADIDAPEAWDISTGSGNMVVGVIDSGVNYNHVDLAANIWTNPGETPDDGIDNDENGFIDDIHGWDFANDDNDPMDDFKHGTHVAGTIGAAGNNGVGVAGVNWNVQIMPLKFLDNRGSGTTADAVAAVNYATMMRRKFGVNITVTNNSWGGGEFSVALRDAIQASGEANMLFVASAGNSGGGASFPAKCGLDNIISVAATDHSDALASFSSRGLGVDLAAPGVDILSTMRKNYGTLSGTSMAAPHVTGVAALAWDRLSGTALDDYHMVRDALFAGVDPLPSLVGLTDTEGRLNAYTTLVIADALVGNATTVSIGDVSQFEGDAGTSDFVFTVSRTGDTSAQMTVEWATADGTATVADNQYNFSSGTLTFEPGVASLDIPVQVHGDTAEEAHGTFFVNLTSLQGGTTPALIVDAQGLGTILNDETTISISDATAIEGDTSMQFIEVFAADSGTGELDYPAGLAFGPDLDTDGIPDHLYTATWNSQKILRYDTKTGQSETFVADGLAKPVNVLFGPHGDLYVSNSATSEILRYDAITGAPKPSGGNPGARYAALVGDNSPRGMTFDEAGNLYVATWSEVQRFQGPTGEEPGKFTDIFVSSDSSSLSSAKELQFGPDGNLYVVSGGTAEVLRYDGTTGDFMDAFVPAGSGGLAAPYGLLFANGVLHVGSRGDSDAVLLYDDTTGDFITSYIPGGSGGLDDPGGFVFGTDGTLYVSSSDTDEILRYGPASLAAFTVSLSTPVPYSVTVDASTSEDTATADADYVSIPAASPRTVTFSPNDTSQSLLVPTLDDGLVEPSETFGVTLSNLSGANPGDLTGLGTILDNEPPPPQPGITVSPTSGLVTTEAGGAASFTVVLDTQPTAAVTIDISSSKPDEGTVSPTSLTFTTTNWSTPQPVTVTGLDDSDPDGDVAYTIVTASATGATEYEGIDPADVLVTNVDNETPVGLAVESIAPNTMDAGSSINVTISGSGFAAGASVTFTNGSGPAPTASKIIIFGGTSITATVSAHKKAKASVWDVVVTNADGSTGICSGCFGVGVVPSAHATNQQFAMAASLDVQADETHTVPHGASISLLALAFESSTVETFLGDGGSGGTSRLFVEEAADIDYTTRTANRWPHTRAVDDVMTLRGREGGSAEETSFELDGIGGDLWEDLIVA